MIWQRADLWVLAIGASAALAIWGRSPDRIVLHWVFKPLATACIGGALLVLAPASFARNLFAVGVLLSLLGDVFLMMPARWFIAGLGSFLASLLTYAVAFSFRVPLSPRQGVYFVLPAAVGVLVLRHLWPHLVGKRAKLRIPIALYVLAMSSMVWRALSLFDGPSVSLQAWLVGAVGASLFMTSDSLLAFRRFADHKLSARVDLGIYYAAQTALVFCWIV